MRLHEIEINQRRLTFESLVNAVATDVLAQYQELSRASNNFAYTARKIMPRDSIHELHIMIVEYHAVAHQYKAQMSHTLAIIEEMLHWLET